MISAERYGPWAVVAGGSEGKGRQAEQIFFSGIPRSLFLAFFASLRESFLRAIEAAVDIERQLIRGYLAGYDPDGNVFQVFEPADR